MQELSSGVPEGGPHAAEPDAPFGLVLPAGWGRVEQARLVIDRPGGVPALDRLAELASRLVRSDAAQVSVVADHQVVMGAAGPAVASLGQSTPAADSLCTVTVEAAETVVVGDAHTDPRVRDLPPVASGAVGSYLGVPVLSAGHVVGALCVFSAEVRPWTAEEVEIVEHLAGSTASEIELALLESSYEEDRVLWQVAVDAAGVGAFDWDLDSGALRWDDRLLEIFGHTRESFGGTIEAFDACLHVDDRARVGAALTQAIATCGGYAAEYRVVRPGGDVRWIAARGHAVAGADGRAARVVGAAYDTTATHDLEARLARTLEVMPTAFYHLDSSWQFTYANPEARRLLAPMTSELVGGDLWEMFPDLVGSDFERHYRGVVATGRPASFEAYYPPPLDAWYEVRCWPVPDGVSVYFIDITKNRQARAVLESAARRAELLAEVTRALTATLDVDEAVGRLTQILVPFLGDWCVITHVEGSLPPDPDTERGWQRRLADIGWWHADPAARPLVERYARLRVPALTERSLVAEALRTRETVVVPSGAAESIAAVLTPGEVTDLCVQLAPSAAAVLLLQGRGRLAGLMTVFRSADRGSFTEEDLELLSDVADRAGLALDNAHLYAGQRKLAETLQRSMLTAPPPMEEAQVVVRYEPADESAQVGGDWYDVFHQGDGSLVVAIGDVVGHDVAAAADMGEVRGLLRGIAASTGDGPAAVLTRVGTGMTTLRVDTIATAVLARIEDAPDGGRRLRWSNAGHPPPVLVVPGVDGAVDVRLLWADDADPMLGLGDDDDRRETVVDVPPGSLLLLYTDGLVERRGEVLDVGLERMRAALAELGADRALDDLADRLLGRLLPGWTEDDVALVLVRVGTGPA